MNDYDKWLSRMITYCCKSEKCKYDVEKKLYPTTITAKEKTTIIDYLISNKYIDEKRYAIAFTHDKHILQKWGTQKIISHLRQKHITEQNINEAIYHLSEEINPKETLTKILTNKFNHDKESIDKYRLYNRLLQYGISRGYDYEDVKNVVVNLLSEFRILYEE